MSAQPSPGELWQFSITSLLKIQFAVWFPLNWLHFESPNCGQKHQVSAVGRYRLNTTKKSTQHLQWASHDQGMTSVGRMDRLCILGRYVSWICGSKCRLSRIHIQVIQIWIHRSWYVSWIICIWILIQFDRHPGSDGFSLGMTHSGQPKNPDGNPAHPWHTKLENWPANIPRITRPKEHFTSWRAKEQLGFSIPSISIVSSIFSNCEKRNSNAFFWLSCNHEYQGQQIHPCGGTTKAGLDILFDGCESNPHCLICHAPQRIQTQHPPTFRVSTPGWCMSSILRRPSALWLFLAHLGSRETQVSCSSCWCYWCYWSCWWRKSCTSWSGRISHDLQGFIPPRFFLFGYFLNHQQYLLNLKKILFTNLRDGAPTCPSSGAKLAGAASHHAPESHHPRWKVQVARSGVQWLSLVWTPRWPGKTSRSSGGVKTFHVKKHTWSPTNIKLLNRTSSFLKSLVLRI